MVHDVPVVIGKVEPEQKFCPDYEVAESILGPAAAAIPPAFNPETGKPDGLWIPKGRWENLASKGQPLWDHFEYMVRHLERVLWNHLASFVGVQEVKTMLDEWTGSGEDEGALIQKAVPDETARVRLVQVLQRLVTERVPINDLRIILTTFADANTTSPAPELSDVVECLRAALRKDLPGNDEKRRLIGLSPDEERAMARWVSERDGKRFLALPPQEAQAFLAAVRGRGGSRAAEDLALVIRTPHLRPFAQRLVEVEFPLLPVLAESELGDGLAWPGGLSEFDG
jgi:flagellar biosynthesis protein FlhA